MKSVYINIFGQVHHKGFRFYAMQTAYRFGIKGFAHNKKDGSLYIEAEGEEENLTEFIEWCKKGPIGAKVENVTTEEGEIKNYTSFDIK